MLYSPKKKLNRIADTRLAEDAAPVACGCLEGDAEFSGNLFSGAAQANQPKHFQLPWGEPFHCATATCCRYHSDCILTETRILCERHHSSPFAELQCASFQVAYCRWAVARSPVAFPRCAEGANGQG